MTSFCSVLYMLIYHVASFLYRGMYKDSLSCHLVQGIHPRICTVSSLLICLASSLPSWWFAGCNLALCYSIFSCCRCWVICVGGRHCCQPSVLGYTGWMWPRSGVFHHGWAPSWFFIDLVLLWVYAIFVVYCMLELGIFLIQPVWTATECLRFMYAFLKNNKIELW
jgi:hypothetical protein